MDNVPSKAGYFDADLEKGEMNEKLDSSRPLVFGNTRMNQFHTEASNGGIKYEERLTSSVASSSDNDLENVKLIVLDKKVVKETNGDVPEKKIVKERPKAMSAKKPPKPPRPPRGLSLDLADQKLIRELHELAKLKRARIERMKALKKAKETKTASSKNQLFATLLTVLFFIVVLFQGISSRTSPVASFHRSLTSSGVTEHAIISSQQYPSSFTSNVNGPNSESPRLVEQVSGVDMAERASRAVG